MKKLSLLCLASEKDASLEALRKAGVLHVSSVKPPEGKGLDAARARHARVEKALQALQAAAADEIDGEKTNADADAEAVVTETNALIERRKSVGGDLERLKHHAEKIEPLGDFDPASVVRLANSGLSVRFYRTASKNPIVAPDGAFLKELSRGKAYVYFAVIDLKHEIKEAPAEWDEIELPEPALSECRNKIAEKERELSSIETELRSLASNANSVEQLLQEVGRDVEFLTVRSGMGENRAIAYLQGFCPEQDLQSVRAAAKQQGWGLLIEDPGPNDKPPTLLKYPVWAKPIKAVFEMIDILPGYREIDISAAFLLFFSVFFAMIIGDAGYGFLFLGLTLIARRMLRKAPTYPFVMLGILSVCTIVWGILNGNYFGIESAPAPLRGFSIEWLNETTNVMKLCFLIGAIHLSLAHAWNALRIINTPRAIAQLGWILITWTMFLAANHFVCGAEFPFRLGIVMGGTGLAAIILFMTPVRQLKSEFILHAMLPLNVINNFVDVVSYVRLFAVGMATVQVAQSFNGMAMQAGAGSIWAAPAAAFILLAGHTLNIMLCALGVLVHGVRLNTLEFSNHIGLEWSGMKYDPFCSKDVKVDA